MDCFEALEAISAALDGELSPKERAVLSEHLMNCPNCREIAEDFRVLTDLLDASDVAPPPELAARIQKAVAEELPSAGEAASAAPAPKRRPYWRTAAAMLALCTCLGGVGLFVAGQRMEKNSNGASSSSTLQLGPRAMDVPGGASGPSAEGTDEAAADHGGISPAECAPSAAPEPACAPPVPEPANGQKDTAAPSAGAQEDGLSPPPGSVGAAVAPSVYGGGETEPITSEEALELAFEYVGGYERFPEATHRVVSMYGFDAPAYCLETVETDAVSSEYCLDYVGTSSDGQGYRFHLYEIVTDKGEDGADRTATMNWYTVSSEGEVTEEYRPD